MSVKPEKEQQQAALLSAAVLRNRSVEVCRWDWELHRHSATLKLSKSLVEIKPTGKASNKEIKSWEQSPHEWNWYSQRRLPKTSLEITLLGASPRWGQGLKRGRRGGYESGKGGIRCRAPFSSVFRESWQGWCSLAYSDSLCLSQAFHTLFLDIKIISSSTLVIDYIAF